MEQNPLQPAPLDLTAIRIADANRTRRARQRISEARQALDQLGRRVRALKPRDRNKVLRKLVARHHQNLGA